MAVQINRDGGIATLRIDIDRVDGGCEVSHIEAPVQALGNRRAGKLQIHATANLFHIAHDLVVAERNHDLTFIEFIATPERDIGNGRTSGGRLLRSGGSSCRSWGSCNNIVPPQMHHQGIAFDAGLIVHGRHQIEHQPCAVTGFQHHDALGIAGAKLKAPLRQAALHIAEVDGNACGIRLGEACGLRRNAVELESHFDAVTRQIREADAVQRYSVLCLRERSPDTQKHHRQASQPAPGRSRLSGT